MTPEPTPEAVREALRSVVDPELGINVVDLGLVYRVELTDAGARVALTMTSPACPLGAALAAEAEAAIRARLPGLRDVAVDLVWEPPWQPSMMADAARRQLGRG